MEVINNYILLKKIAEGGMSEVYLAEHKYLHKINALKKLKLQDRIVSLTETMRILSVCFFFAFCLAGIANTGEDIDASSSRKR